MSEAVSCHKLLDQNEVGGMISCHPMDLQDKQRQFETEYRDLFAQIYRFIRIRVQHEQDAEDLVSDVIMLAFSKVDSFEPEKGCLSQWLTGIARYKVLDYWRGHHVNVSIEEIEEFLAAPDRGVLDALDNRMLVERLIHDLPQAAKLLIIMRYNDDMTFKEIAAAIGKEPPAVRKLFSRLHEKLRMSAPEMIVK